MEFHVTANIFVVLEASCLIMFPSRISQLKSIVWEVLLMASPRFEATIRSNGFPTTKYHCVPIRTVIKLLD